MQNINTAPQITTKQPPKPTTNIVKALESETRNKVRNRASTTKAEQEQIGVLNEIAIQLECSDMDTENKEIVIDIISQATSSIDSTEPIQKLLQKLIEKRKEFLEAIKSRANTPKVNVNSTEGDSQLRLQSIIKFDNQADIELFIKVAKEEGLREKEITNMLVSQQQKKEADGTIRTAYSPIRQVHGKGSSKKGSRAKARKLINAVKQKEWGLKNIGKALVKLDTTAKQINEAKIMPTRSQSIVRSKIKTNRNEKKKKLKRKFAFTAFQISMSPIHVIGLILSGAEVANDIVRGNKKQDIFHTVTSIISGVIGPVGTVLEGAVDLAIIAKQKQKVNAKQLEGIVKEVVKELQDAAIKTEKTADGP